MIVKIVHGVVYATLSSNLRRACPSVAKILRKLPPPMPADHYYLFILAHDTANWSRIINLARREEKNLKIVNRRGKFFFELPSFRSIEQMIEEKEEKESKDHREEFRQFLRKRRVHIYIYIRGIVAYHQGTKVQAMQPRSKFQVSRIIFVVRIKKYTLTYGHRAIFALKLGEADYKQLARFLRAVGSERG